MGKKSEQTVIVSREFHYDLTARSRRTLPVGWQGLVPGDVAKQIKEEGAGVIVSDLVKPKKKAAGAVAAKKAEEEAAAKKAEEEAAAKKAEEEAAAKKAEEEAAAKKAAIVDPVAVSN